MCAIPQLASAPLNPIPIAEHFRRSHPQCEHSYGQLNWIMCSLRTPRPICRPTYRSRDVGRASVDMSTSMSAAMSPGARQVRRSI